MDFTRFRDSVVKIVVLKVKKSLISPLTLQRTRTTGSGFVIDGFVVTNSHVVADGQMIEIIKPDGASFNIKPSNVYNSPLLDTAIITMPKAFWKTAKPLKLGGITKPGTIYYELGYRQGGDTLSFAVGKGRINRVIMQLEGLVYEGDNTSTFGSSGSAVINQDDEVIAIAYALRHEDNDPAYSIMMLLPIEHVTRLINLQKINPKYRGLCSWQFASQPTNNPAKREYLGLQDYPDAGVLVTKGHSNVKDGDIILSINNKTIRPDGLYLDERYQTFNKISSIFAECMPGDKITLKILRNKKEIEVTEVAEIHSTPFPVMRHDVDGMYLCLGGLVMANYSWVLACEIGDDVLKEYYDNLQRPGIVLVDKYPDVINDSYPSYAMRLATVNGNPVDSIQDLDKAIKKLTDKYIILDFDGAIIVFDRVEALARSKEINQEFFKTSELLF